MLLAELVVPTAWCPKLRLELLSVTGETPFPLKVTTCGLSAALSVMVNEPELLPVVVGVKLTLTWQDVLGARVELPQLLHW